jgi:hypothetical protein
MSYSQALLSQLLAAAMLVLAVAFSSDLPTAEMSALFDLYNTTGGVYWNWRPEVIEVDSHVIVLGSPWNFTKNSSTGEYIYKPCGGDLNLEWQGVTCVDSHVNKLEMIFFNLSGTVPDSIGQFGNLTSLQMFSNKLIGTLPSTLGDLSNLEKWILITIA